VTLRHNNTPLFFEKCVNGVEVNFWFNKFFVNSVAENCKNVQQRRGIICKSNSRTILFIWCGKTKLSCGLSAGHIKYHKTIAIRSHLQVATTATFCTCSVSFDLEPSFSIFEQTSSFEFHMHLSAQQQKNKVFFGHHLTSVSGWLFQHEKKNFNAGMYDEILPWVGHLWLSRLALQDPSVQPLWSHQRVAQSSVLLPTTT